MTYTNVLHALRQLAKTPSQAVHAVGSGAKKLVHDKVVPIPDHLVHEGWASEVWNERGELQGLRITDEGLAWLAELERQHRAYLARP